MPDQTPTVDPAEVEAGARALMAHPDALLMAPDVAHTYAEVVLAAVLPDHDARVRAEERARCAEEVAQAIQEEVTATNWPHSPTSDDGQRAAAIARQHATPPTGGDHHGT